MKNGQNVPILFLSMFLFVLIQVLFYTYFVLFYPIFLEHFPEISIFSRIFPDFPGFFLCSQAYFTNIFETGCDNKM